MSYTADDLTAHFDAKKYGLSAVNADGADLSMTAKASTTKLTASSTVKKTAWIKTKVLLLRLP